MARSATRAAALRGIRTATKLQRDLGLDQGEARGRRIDVFGTIVRAGVPLMFDQLEPLLGAYMRPGGQPGIILTTRRPLGQQRFTAAHELGHHMLNHDPHADDERILRRAPGAGSVPKAEQEADAFASQFLLPNWLLKTQMERHDWTPRHLTSPEIVYQASLRCGSSYTATIHALERAGVFGAQVRNDLRRYQPARMKRDLVPDTPLKTTENIDVWRLTEKDEGTLIEAGRDDLFVLCLREDSSAGYLWTFDELKNAGFALLKDGREAVAEGRLGAPVIRRIIARADSDPAHGTYTVWETRPWDPTDDPKSFGFEYRPVITHETGLFRLPGDEVVSN